MAVGHCTFSTKMQHKEAIRGAETPWWEKIEGFGFKKGDSQVAKTKISDQKCCLNQLQPPPPGLGSSTPCPFDQGIVLHNELLSCVGKSKVCLLRYERQPEPWSKMEEWMSNSRSPYFLCVIIVYAFCVQVWLYNGWRQGLLSANSLVYFVCVWGGSHALIKNVAWTKLTREVCFPKNHTRVCTYYKPNHAKKISRSSSHMSFKGLIHTKDVRKYLHQMQK